MDSPTAPTTPFETGPADAESPAVGGALGRFIIEGSLGVGGMGVVLKARDPDLGRTVAIKVLRPDVADRGGHERLRREAQVMAKIAHPNVVSVFEVGEVNGQIFVVMEHVEGQTLRAWLSEKERSQREIIAMMIGAGRGLEAAHTAGLVHRDVKPSNILIGKDGRPRIGDFGIARYRPFLDPGLSGPESARSPDDVRAGTVGYMAPEHVAGKELDARADQFSFCATLHEALHGELPFAADSFTEYKKSVLGGQRNKAPRRALPARLDAILGRGLAPDPAERWPDMASLLAALSEEPAGRRRIWIGASVLASAAVIAGVSAWSARAAPAAPECASGPSQLAGIWDAPRKQAVQEAFSSTKVPYAPRTFELVSADLDKYTAAWGTMYEEACRATRVEGRQSDSLLDARMACLDREKKKLQVVVTELAAPAPRTVTQASDIVRSLPAVEACADVAALTEAAPLPADPAARARIAALFAKLDAASVKLETDPKSGLAAEDALVTEIAAAGYAPLLAAAQLEYGRSLRRRGKPEEAAAMLKRAAESAGAAHNDALAVEAFAELARCLAIDIGELPKALSAVEAGEAFLARSGGAPEAKAQIRAARGNVMRLQGKLGEARAALEEAYRIKKENQLEGGAEILNTLAIVASQQGRSDAAAEYSQSAVRGTEELYGPEHPAVAEAVNTLGYVFAMMGDYGQAEPLFLRSLAIAEKSLPPSSTDAIILRTNVACIRLVRGHLQEAELLFDQTLRVCEEAGLGEGLEASEAMVNFAELRRLQGRSREAESLVQKALDIRKKRLPPDHTELVLPLHVLAHLRMDQGRLPEAEALLVRALAIAKAGGEESQPYLEVRIREAELRRLQKKDGEAQKILAAILGPLEAAAGKSHPLVAEAIVGWAQADEKGLASHVERLQRAAEIAETHGLDPFTRGAANAYLSRALRAAGEEEKGRAAAERAEKDLGAATLPMAAKQLAALREFWKAPRH